METKAIGTEEPLVTLANKKAVHEMFVKMTSTMYFLGILRTLPRKFLLTKFT